MHALATLSRIPSGKRFGRLTRSARGTLLALVVLVGPGIHTSRAAPAAESATEMLEQIEADFRDTAFLTGIKSMSAAVSAAMASVPRHAFVPTRSRHAAYENRPLPIGNGQTISQPFIVALMTELAAVGPGSRVLEIGTGSGYQAAVLAALGADVYSIEIIEALSVAASKRLADLGYEVDTKVGDGNLGWPDYAPYDAIVVTAGGAMPPALPEQLKPGGRLVIPLDSERGDQDLVVLTRQTDGTSLQRVVLPVRFVPLVRDGR